MSVQYRRTEAECRDCGYQFMARARYEGMETSDLGTVAWTIAKDEPFEGQSCRGCGSKKIGPRDQ